MPGSDCTIFLLIMTMSDYVILTLKIFMWTKNMSDYTLLPDPSSLAIFNSVRAFFKTGLSTDRRYCERKKTMAT